MKFKPQIDGKETEIEIKLTGKDCKTVWSKLSKLTKDAQDGNIDGVADYMAHVEKIVCEKASITLDQLDSMDIDQRNKMTAYVENKAKDMLGFSLPSPK